jgi:hypothetical protein
LDPPSILRGDLLDKVAPLADQAPSDATLVLFHSAVMPYLPSEDRQRFVKSAVSVPGVWVSFEGRGVLPEIDGKLPKNALEENAFVLARDGEPVAVADPHGRWLRWLHRL